jgi:hypothetical protein
VQSCAGTKLQADICLNGAAKLVHDALKLLSATTTILPELYASLTGLEINVV